MLVNSSVNRYDKIRIIGTIAIATILSCSIFFLTIASAEESEAVRQDLHEQIIEETQTKPKVIKLLSSYLYNLEISGGLSGGWFYTTEPGRDNKDSNFVLSNLLLDISSEIVDEIACFNIGLGGVSTPSVLSSPNKAVPVFDIEYAQINLEPVKSILLETGLLRPNSGYESTYTFNNPNITVGALASQQPYNALGARFTYIYNEELKVWAGMYKHRLSDDEYTVENVYMDEYGEPRSLGAQDSSSYEFGINSSIKRIGLNFYHYHLNGLRHLTGIIIDYNELKHIYLALNADYWRWSDNVEKYFKDKSADGVAIYVVPSIGKLLFPFRLEYIHEGESRIYLDNAEAKAIYAITFTPTYNLLSNVYIRSEASYVYANDGFQNTSGTTANGKYNFAIETGIKL